LCALTNTAPAPKKEGEDQAIGRSKGGLSTKIHATVDALGNPTGIRLAAGQAHNLDGSDELLPRRRRTSDRTVSSRRKRAPHSIQSQSQGTSPHDKEYKARHLIENFFCKLKQFRAIATRYDKTARAAIHLASGTVLLN
jgi:transposase